MFTQASVSLPYGTANALIGIVLSVVVYTLVNIVIVRAASRSDFARLAKPSDEKYHVAVTFGWLYYTLTFFVNGLLGILLVSTLDITFAELAGQESALPVQIVNLTGVVGLALIAVTQMRINTVNLYLASTNLQGFFSRLHLDLPRIAWVVVACGISFLLMLTNVFNYVLDALNYQGIAIVAWVAVALAHVGYLRRSSRRPERGPCALHACDRSYIAREMDRDPTAGHQAICAGCATSLAFYRASRQEASRPAQPAERGASREPHIMCHNRHRSVRLVDGRQRQALQSLETLMGGGADMSLWHLTASGRGEAARHEQARAER